MRVGRACSGWFLATFLCACTPLACRYHRPQTRAGATVKAHLELSVWSEAQTQEGPVADVVREVAKGLIGTRRTFLMAEDWIETNAQTQGCRRRERVWLRLEVREAVHTPSGQTSMNVVADLRDCATGATLWHAERTHHAVAQDASLRALAENLGEKLGTAAKNWAAPAFVTLQPLIEDMPDCHLTEDEVLERIELGALRGPSFG